MPTKEDKPLTREELRFVTEFRKYRDIPKAAQKAKIARNRMYKIFNSTAFQEELDRQEEAVRQERAKLEVKVEALTRDFLDQEMAALIRTSEGSIKKEALALGYVVLGTIQNGGMRSTSGPQSGDSGDDPGKTVQPTFIYRATVEGTVTQAEPLVSETPLPPPIVPQAPTKPIASSPASRRAGPLKIE
jgi:hypothetical protein